MKLFGKKFKGFSLIELVVVMSIIIFLVGVAAAYFSDYLYRAKVAKAYEDLDVFAAAIQLYNAEMPDPLTYANYSTAVATIGVSLQRHFPQNNSDTASRSTSETGVWTAKTDTLNTLLGKYLTTIPADPWGGGYSINTHTGAVFSYGEDGLKDIASISGSTTNNRNKDLIRYYLSSNFAFVKAVILDRTNDTVVNLGDTIEISFSSTVGFGVNTHAVGTNLRALSNAPTAPGVNLQAIFAFANSQPALANAATAAGPTFPLNGRIKRIYNEPRMLHHGLVAQDITAGFGAGKWIGENSMFFNAPGGTAGPNRKLFTPNPWYCTGVPAATAATAIACFFIGKTNVIGGVEYNQDMVGKGLSVNGVVCSGFKIY